MYTSFYMWILYMQWVGIGFLVLLMSIFMHLQYRQAPSDFRGPSQKLLPLFRLAKLALIISIHKNPVSRKWLNQGGHWHLATSLRPISLCFSTSRLKPCDSCLFQVVLVSGIRSIMVIWHQIDRKQNKRQNRFRSQVGKYMVCRCS